MYNLYIYIVVYLLCILCFYLILWMFYSNLLYEVEEHYRELCLKSTNEQIKDKNGKI